MKKGVERYVLYRMEKMKSLYNVALDSIHKSRSLSEEEGLKNSLDNAICRSIVFLNEWADLKKYLIGKALKNEDKNPYNNRIRYIDEFAENIFEETNLIQEIDSDKGFRLFTEERIKDYDFFKSCGLAFR